MDKPGIHWLLLILLLYCIAQASRERIGLLLLFHLQSCISHADRGHNTASHCFYPASFLYHTDRRCRACNLAYLLYQHSSLESKVYMKKILSEKTSQQDNQSILLQLLHHLYCHIFLCCNSNKLTVMLLPGRWNTFQGGM